MATITKEEFDAAYNKYPPSGLLKFVYTHYNVRLRRRPRPIGTWTAVIAWIVSTVGLIVFNEIGMREVAEIFVYGYIPFASLIIALPAFLLNKARVKKIVKELGITPDHYNNLVDLYYPDGMS